LAKIEKSIDIEAPPEKIWPMVYWDKIPQWMDIIPKAEFTSKNKDGLGAIAHVNGEAGGIKSEWVAETTEWNENKRFAWRTLSGTFTAFGSMTLTPTKTGTRATIIMDYDLPYSFLGKLVDKLRVSKDMDKGFTRAMEKLKEITER
jgi:uncharacterized membrane protein